MALQMPWSEMGFECPEAYIRICGVNVLPGQRTAVVQLWIYQNQAARDAGKAPLFAHSYSAVGAEFDELFNVAVLDGNTNPIQQSYIWLKRPHPTPEGAPGPGMPDFTAAIDILEAGQ